MNKIKEFNSIIEASKELDIGKSNIRGVVINYRKSAGGFIFKYLEDNNKYDVVIPNNRNRRVIQYSLEMNQIKEFNSIVEASKELKIHKNNIWAVIRNYKKTAGGFIFKYLD